MSSIDEVCRLCNFTSTELIPLFPCDNEPSTRNLPDLVKLYINLKVSRQRLKFHYFLTHPVTDK